MITTCDYDSDHNDSYNGADHQDIDVHDNSDDGDSDDSVCDCGDNVDDGDGEDDGDAFRFFLLLWRGLPFNSIEIHERQI